MGAFCYLCLCKKGSISRGQKHAFLSNKGVIANKKQRIEESKSKLEKPHKRLSKRKQNKVLHI